MPSQRMREEAAARKKAEAAAARKAERLAELPSWLRTKPRTGKQEREARLWCESRGIPYPFD